MVLPTVSCSPARWACHAGVSRLWGDFGLDAAWGPVTNNKGVWTPRAQLAGLDRSSLSYAFFLLIVRLGVGALAFVVLLGLLILSAIPYGGGGSTLIGLMWIVALVVPVWAAVPLVVSLFQKGATARRPGRTENDS